MQFNFASNTLIISVNILTGNTVGCTPPAPLSVDWDTCRALCHLLGLLGCYSVHFENALFFVVVPRRRWSTSTYPRYRPVTCAIRCSWNPHRTERQRVILYSHEHVRDKIKMLYRFLEELGPLDSSHPKYCHHSSLNIMRQAVHSLCIPENNV